MWQVGLLWRAEWDPRSRRAGRRELPAARMFAAFPRLGVDAEPVVYSDDAVDAVREQLLGLDGVLVWVNPIEQGLDRSGLDPLLREVRGRGLGERSSGRDPADGDQAACSSDTASMSWSAETYLYGSLDQVRAELPPGRGGRARSC